ncbi:MAG: hypothetical protein AAF447_10795 [Myxococcota bacterium]
MVRLVVGARVLLGVAAWFACVGVPAIVSVAPSVAAAQGRRGAVLAFRGRGGPAVRREVVAAANARLELVPRAEVRAQAESLGVDLATVGGRAAVAEQLGLSVLLEGRVRGRGRAAVSELRAYDDRGELRSQREGPGPNGRANRLLLRDLATEIVDETVFAIQQREAAEEEARMQAEMRAQRAAAEVAEQAAGDPEVRRVNAGALPLLRATVGVQGRTRDARVDLVEGGARTYDAGLYPELTLRFESFFLRQKEGLARGLYAELAFAFALGLSSNELTTDGSGTTSSRTIDTSAWRLLVQLGYQLPLAQDRVLLGALVGFGIDTFDLGENTTFFGSRYTQLRTGIVAQLQIVQELLVARLDAGFLPVFETGDLGTQHGDGGATRGFDLGLALTGRLGAGFAYGLRVGYTRYSLGFGGDEAAGPVGSGGFDRSLTMGLELGGTF